MHDAVEDEGQNRGQKQHHADRRAHGEILLADDLLVDVGGQHVVLAAHDLGRAEVREAEDEADEGGRKQAVAHPGQGDREKDARGRGPHGARRFVEPRVRGAQGHRQDQHHLGKGEDRLGNDDADRAVEPDVPGQVHAEGGLERAEKARGHKALVAEEIDEVDAVEQRRRKQRGHGQAPEKALARNVRAGERIGEGKAEADGQDRGHQRDVDAVPKRLRQGRVLEKGAEIGQPRPDAVAVVQAFADDLGQGQEHRAHEKKHGKPEQRGAQPAFGKQGLAPHGDGCGRDRGKPFWRKVSPRPLSKDF